MWVLACQKKDNCVQLHVYCVCMCDSLSVRARVCPSVTVCARKNMKLFSSFLLVYFHSFLQQRWEVLMRVHQPLPPDNKYQSTKPINTVIVGAHRFAGNYALWMFLKPASLPTLCCPCPGSPDRSSKATESQSMGAGPIRGGNTQRWRLLLDQPSKVVPCVVFQLSYWSLPGVSAWREKTAGSCAVVCCSAEPG